MIQKNIFMVIDTETADLSGNIYDIGWVICDKNGNIFAEYNALVTEVFTDSKKMMGAYYAHKLFTHYAPMLDQQAIHLERWENIVAIMNAHIEQYAVTTICAYNAAFDFRVIGNTHKNLGFSGKALNASVKTLDIWRFACETKLQQKAYKKIAKKLGWVSKAGNINSGAEYAYRFCSGEFGFIEDHTALSDARIEAQILAACFRTKKSIPYNQIGGQPWRLIQDAA